MQDLLLSGVQPTNNLHIGNYIGALKQWVELQHRYPCYFCVVDLHAITVPQDPATLRKNILNVAAAYIAVGIDPSRSTIFVQSEVKEHTELGWILGTMARLGEMERMTQFKDKSKKEGERASLGLFSYPALMAADILLYDTTVVPVGEDQAQHVELTRTLAKRFNDTFGPTFTIPQALIQKHGARIMALDDPRKKMSKSAASQNSFIALTDSADAIRKKIMRAVTDSGEGVVFDPEGKPAIANLMVIYHHMTGRTMADIEKEYKGKGYGDFKKGLAEAVVDHLAPITKRILAYKKNPEELEKILDRGREAAQKAAGEKMALVRDRVGLGRACT